MRSFATTCAVILTIMAVTFRKHLSHYLKGLPGSEALLGELFATSDADVLGAAVSRYFERLQDDEQGLG